MERKRLECLNQCFGNANPDPDPAFYLNADEGPGPDPGQPFFCRHKKLDFDIKILFMSVMCHKTYRYLL